MFRRTAFAVLFLALFALCLCGCQSQGTLTFAQSAASDEDDTSAKESGAGAWSGAELPEADFAEAFMAIAAQNGRTLTAIEGEGDQERSYRIGDVSIEPEIAEGFELHIFSPAGEVESVTLTMPLPALKDEDDVPKGDEAALASLRKYNEARARERAAYMDCVEAALRAVNKYKNTLSEANVLTVLADAEKTLKRGSEQNEELSGAVSRSFLLDVSYTPQIVFTLEFIL